MSSRQVVRRASTASAQWDGEESAQNLSAARTATARPDTGTTRESHRRAWRQTERSARFVAQILRVLQVFDPPQIPQVRKCATCATSCGRRRGNAWRWRRDDETKKSKFAKRTWNVPWNQQLHFLASQFTIAIGSAAGGVHSGGVCHVCVSQRR